MPNTTQLEKTYDHLLRIWGIQYNLLQGYRALFTAINIFAITGAIKLAFSETNILLLEEIVLILIGAFGVYLCNKWKKVVIFRRHNVYYIEKKLLEYEDEAFTSNIMNDLLTWQEKSAEEKGEELKKDKHGVIVSQCKVNPTLDRVRQIFFISWLAIILFAAVQLTIIANNIIKTI